MRTKLQIAGSYKNFLKALNTEGTDVFKTYEKMYQYIENVVNKVDEELYTTLWWSCAENAINTIKGKGITFKQDASEWDRRSVDDCFKFIDLIKEADEKEKDSIFRINLYRLFKLFRRTEIPNLRLYMVSKYRNTEYGYDLLSACEEKAQKLLESSTEEEIEAILHQDTKTADLDLEFESEEPPIDKLVLFELFNPKNLEETKECYEKLEEMHACSKICKEDYAYVRDILLLPRMAYYKKGGVYKEPTTNTKETITVIDGEKFLEDELEEATA